MGDTHWIKLSVFNLTAVNIAIQIISSNSALFRVCSGISAKVVIVNLQIMMLYPK
jgi:hypothetical protein